MRAVSNTSPLRYLISSGHVDLLARIFAEVLIPVGVADELADSSAPSKVRAWIAHPPIWATIKSLRVPLAIELMTILDRGEREAIQLMEEQRAELLIMDERKGRAIAISRGIPLTGLLGLLGTAYQQAILEDPLAVLEEVRQHGFYIADDLVRRFRTLLATRYSR